MGRPGGKTHTDPHHKAEAPGRPGWFVVARSGSGPFVRLLWSPTARMYSVDRVATEGRVIERLGSFVARREQAALAYYDLACHKTPSHRGRPLQSEIL